MVTYITVILKGVVQKDSTVLDGVLVKLDSELAKEERES